MLATPDHSDEPIWAREDAFPRAPHGWGWMDYKRRIHPCDSAEVLIGAIRDDLNADVALAWTPAHEFMILPEEVEGATGAVLASRKRRAADDLLHSLEKLRWFGWLLAGLAIYMFYQGWSLAPRVTAPAERVGFALHAVIASVSMGVAALMFLIFGFIPWYQARKQIRELEHWSDGEIAAVVPTLRFETWLEWQKAPVTYLFLGLITMVGLAQLMPDDGIAAAGLVKERYFQGEWWRLFTAPFLHGNLVHFLMNAAALIYLGRRVEVFARWPHLPMVFLFSACIGGEASARFMQATSIGASGGLMGWLGFLLVFESLHSHLVPRQAKRRLAAGVLLTGVIGLVGYRFIDNAAHLGGLLAGMVYAGIVFPKSSSSNRPHSTITDRIVGGVSLGILITSAIYAAIRIATA